MITCIPGGFLAERFGATKVVLVSTLLSGALTLFTPLAASWHFSLVIIDRFLLGFAAVSQKKGTISITFLQIMVFSLIGSAVSLSALFDLPMGSSRRKREVCFDVVREHFRHCNHVACSGSNYRLYWVDLGVLHSRNRSFDLVLVMVVRSGRFS